jgi:hypothetical protein
MEPSKSRELLEMEVRRNELSLHNRNEEDLEKLWKEAEVVLLSDPT